MEDDANLILMNDIQRRLDAMRQKEIYHQVDMHDK